MKSIRNLRKVMTLMGLMIILSGSVKATTYYLITPSKADVLSSWNSNLSGGNPTEAKNFTTSGDLFIIQDSNEATFRSSSETIFGTGVTLNVIGSIIIDAGQTKTTTLQINGFIAFSNISATQVSFTGSGTKSFVLGDGATLVTQNTKGITGVSGCSLPTSGTLATVTLPTSANYEFNGGIQNTAGLPATVNNLTISGTGTKSLAAATTITKTLTINTENILNIDGNTASAGELTGSGTLSGTSAFTTGSLNTNSTFSGTISGTLSLTKTGSGTLTLGTNPVDLSALTISLGNLTILPGGNVTVSGATTVNTTGSLTLESNETLTGSLITTSASGTASVIRYMAPKKWHIVSSPVSGQTVGGFLGANDNISNNIATGAPTGEDAERGMRGYDVTNNQWGNFYTNKNTEAMTKGKGFLMRVKSAGDQNVTFTGPLITEDFPVSGLETGKWNCIGNPYTSAIRIKEAVDVESFLKTNASSLDDPYKAIYIWHQTADEGISIDGKTYYETSGSYQTISNVPFNDANLEKTLDNDVQQGQAFMVKMASTASSLSFTKAMQLHNTPLALKSTENIWPAIKLTATADSITSSTIVAFHEGMTPGLDPTYDAGLLKGGAPVEVYTRLIEDNGIPFDIQALPANYESTVIPVGLDCTRGQQVSFSAELMHLPSACQVILEDRLTRSFTDLSANSYTADLMGNTVSQDRFFLHTSYSTTRAAVLDDTQPLRAWAVSNQELMISGELSSSAIATLYDLQGRAVTVCPLQQGTLRSMPLKGLQQGVYLLRVQDNNNARVLKVMIGQ